MFDEDPQHMSVLRDVTRCLLRHRLFASAEITGSCLIAGSSLPGRQPGLVLSTDLGLYADALSGKGELRRAAAWYTHELQLKAVTGVRRQGRKAAAESSAARQAGHQGVFLLCPETADSRLANQGSVRVLRAAECLLKMGEVKAAIQTLEGIAVEQRTAEMNITLAVTFERAAMRTKACGAYRDALRTCPYAIEAIISLLQLGTDRKEVLQLVRDGLKASLHSPGLEQLPWLQSLVEGHGRAAHRTRDALQHFRNLEQLFPNNLHALLYMGKAHADLEQWDEAQHMFVRARSVDDLNVDLMDYYATVMRHKGNVGLLNRLTHELMEIDSYRPEPWAAAALYSDSRGDQDRAMSFIEKALDINPRYMLGHNLKGSLLLSAEKAEFAQIAFFTANALQKNIQSYAGLIESQLALGKYPEALRTAKEVLALMPRNFRTLMLLGKVLAQDTYSAREGLDAAKRAFRKALLMEPASIDAALALVNCNVADGALQQAIELLQIQLQVCNHDALHAKLADIYTSTSQYAEALTFYHSAISLNPNSTAACAGLDRLEKLMRGVDPDEDMDEMEDAAVMSGGGGDDSTGPLQL